MSIKCTCGEKDCQTQIILDIDPSKNHICFFYKNLSGESLMYLDANATLELIHELQKVFSELAGR